MSNEDKYLIFDMIKTTKEQTFSQEQELSAPLLVVTFNNGK